MKAYNSAEIESKWQKIWAETKVYRATDFDARPKYYMLTEFPYPSGDGLHAGHAREYTLGDVLSRHKRMQGYNVLYPMGYDAFGLPTENFAIKHKIAPQTATANNVATFRQQFDSLGYSFDWDRQVNTTDPNYYKWTQWLFLQFFKHGLAYQDEIAINWCPKCKTGLANEEVVNGRHERCGTVVEKRLLKQWLLKITAYADRLIEGLKSVDYPFKIASQQINWIGRSDGAEVDFKIDGHDAKLTVFTTRPDTLFGATFLVLAPEHPLVEQITAKDQKAEVEEYIKKVQSETELERQEEARPKTGVWTGAIAVNPVNQEKIPVWIADYVLMGYGTGAIMSVPAHDQRDFEFAQKFELPIKQVILKPNAPIKSYVMGAESITERDFKSIGVKIAGKTEAGYYKVEIPLNGLKDFEKLIEEKMTPGFWNEYIADKVVFIFKHKDGKVERLVLSAENERKIRLLGDSFNDTESKDQTPWNWLASNDWYRDIVVHNDEGKLINSGKYDGLVGREAMQAIVEDLFKAGAAKHAVKYKLRDWVFSRQHYWGEPIPIIHCPKCGAVPVPDDQLPVELPQVKNYEPTETGESPLAAIDGWVNVDCPKCGGPAKRETDTMPNWAGSSWYYLRYTDPQNDQGFADYDKLNYWLPVDLYLGGMEHTTLHLLYSRFWHQFLYDQKLVPTPEPYAARRGQGIVLAADGRKMSKSLGNVINPNDIIARYGADSFRLYIMFMAPYDETTPWSDERLNGVDRFIKRTWGLAQELIANVGSESGSATSGTEGAVETAIDRMTHKTLKKVHEDIESMRFNTMVSALMEFANFLNAPVNKQALTDPRYSELSNRTVRALVLMLAPSAPHLAEELWQQLGETESVHIAPWPKYDPELIKDDLVEIAIQVNGRLRGTMPASVNMSDDELKTAASAVESVKKYLDGQIIVKTIVVPRKLVSFVINPD